MSASGESGTYENQHGVSYFVYDREKMRMVAGPFGTRQYAHTVRKRCSWPWPDNLSVMTERRIAQFVEEVEL